MGGWQFPREVSLSPQWCQHFPFTCGACAPQVRANFPNRTLSTGKLFKHHLTVGKIHNPWLLGRGKARPEKDRMRLHVQLFESKMTRRRYDEQPSVGKLLHFPRESSCWHPRSEKSCNSTQRKMSSLGKRHMCITMLWPENSRSAAALGISSSGKLECRLPAVEKQWGMRLSAWQPSRGSALQQQPQASQLIEKENSGQIQIYPASLNAVYPLYLWIVSEKIGKVCCGWKFLWGWIVQKLRETTMCSLSCMGLYLMDIAFKLDPETEFDIWELRAEWTAVYEICEIIKQQRYPFEGIWILSSVLFI